MTAADLDALLMPAGAALLSAAAELHPTPATYPAAADRLAKRFPGLPVRAALDAVMLRAKAAAKFPHAGRMWFDREALEMASHPLAAAHRAGRFAGLGPVADLGCGIGADALAFAAAGLEVVAVDRDPVRLRMAGENLRACHLAATLVEGDLLAADLGGVRSAFADPGRRPAGRTLHPEHGEPPVAAVVGRLPPGFPLAVKLAPGVSRPELARYAADAEFVSVHGELKECVLWFGPFRTGRPTATLLPGPHTLTGEPGDPYDVAPVEAGQFVHDPDPAVVRADLVNELATRLGAWPLEAGYSLLASAADPASPFATTHRVEAVLPLDARTLAGWLRERSIGRVTPVKRGVDVDADALARKCRGPGDGHRRVYLARAGGKRVAVVCEV
jgi:SAM-dependent methyltransferase